MANRDNNDLNRELFVILTRYDAIGLINEDDINNLYVILERHQLENRAITLINNANNNNENHEPVPANEDHVFLIPARPPIPLLPPRRRHAVIPHRVTYRSGLDITIADLEVLCGHSYTCGALNDICQHCGALFYNKEPKNRQNIRLFCCRNNAYSLPQLSECPGNLKNLYLDDSHMAIEFRRNIRRLNSLFAMASFKTSRPEDGAYNPVGQQGHWCFTICGQIYHHIQGIPTLADLETPRLNHYYFLDADDALRKRSGFVEADLDRDLLRRIEEVLRRINRYIGAYRTMGEVLEEERRRRGGDDDGLQNIVIGFMKDSSMNRSRRNFNLPESRSDIAAIFDGDEPPFNVDLKLYPKNPNDATVHHELKNLNPLADPMVYPLLFPCGDNGYSMGMPHNNINDVVRRKNITLSEFYRYRLQIRDGFSTIHHGGKLFQQYIVDAWVRVEADRLWWLRSNQNKFRLALQNVLQRYNQGRVHGNMQDGHVGKSYILPTKFQGSDRCKQRQYLDAMAVVARHGKPDLFITFTCNPRWPEITDNLQPPQKWENRPDLICRVFNVKLQELINDIVQKQIFGVVLNYHYTIEFQKRGLPHAHIVVTMTDGDRILDAESVDKVVQAYIPDRETQPELYRRVADYHVHAPCGRLNPNAPCMKDGKCIKLYPKRYLEQTSMNEGGNKRPEYKRPSDGRTIHWPNTNTYISNRRIVPYNSYLLAKYSCHMNVEVVGSLYTIKYLYKYVNKGYDAITVTADGNRVNTNTPTAQNLNAIVQVDEIQRYLDCRYVSAVEAVWRLFEFKMHDRSHAVLVLPVHLPGQRILAYDEDDDIQRVEERLSKKSKLEAWFLLNTRDASARQFRYSEIPEHYVWDDKDACWKPRRQVSKQIGCVMEVGAVEWQIDKYFLRILLCHVKGATSFEDLLTVVDNETGQRVLCETFREACRRRNYLRNTNEFGDAMREAALQHHPRKIRRLFALLCCVAVDEGIDQIGPLWNDFKKYMVEDFRHRGMSLADSIAATMDEIRSIIERNRPGLTLDALGITNVIDDNFDNDENLRLIANSPEDARDRGAASQPNPTELYRIGNLNVEQKRAFLRILKSCARAERFPIPIGVYDEFLDDLTADEVVSKSADSCFFVDGPGGCGKTFLYNTLINILNNVFKRQTIAVAWTGIAANLLTGGTTVHRAFKLPIELNDDTIAGWPMESQKTKDIIEKVALIIWDEAPMTPKLAVSAVDKYLRDVMRRNVPMGGKMVLFGGDFRQILPVVLGGSRNNILAACLRYSPLWPIMTKISLTTNMRAARLGEQFNRREQELSDMTFAEWLLSVGEGKLPYVTIDAKVAPAASRDLIEIPRRMIAESLEDLLDFVYAKNYTTKENGSKAILCPTNVAVDEVNRHILSKIERAATKTYVALNEFKGNNDQGDDMEIPMDVLNAVISSSLPPHELTLKVGAIVILLRNLDVDDGLCNGSRLIVVKLLDHIIECELLTGINKGQQLYIPRIKMIARDTMLPGDIFRTQFPLRLAYAMTINKSQGQSLQKVGVYLNKPCFTHGQLYVAMSRTGYVDHLKIFIEDTNRQGTFKYRGRRRFTRNVVYYSVLTTEPEPLTPSQDNVPRRLVIDDVIEDPDYRHQPHQIPDDILDIQMANIDIERVALEQQRQIEQDIMMDDALIPRDMVPFRTTQELKRRVAFEDKPGTSGIQLIKRSVPPRPIYSDDSDSD